MDPNIKSEETIMRIGQTYTTSLFTGRGLSSTSFVLTDKTLSGVGRVVGKSRSTVSFKANLDDISSLSLVYKSEFSLLILAFFSLVFTESYLSFSSYYYYGLLVFIILTIFYFLTRSKELQVNIRGVIYGLPLKGVANQDIDTFIETTIVYIRNARQK